MSKQRLIDADVLNEQFEKLKEGVSLIDVVFLDGAMSVVDNSPTIDPETLPIVQELRRKLAECEPKHGYWIPHKKDSGCCSFCGYIHPRMTYHITRFCEQCGAKMN